MKFKPKPQKTDEILEHFAFVVLQRKGGVVRIKVSVVYQDLSETGGTLAECFPFDTLPAACYS